MKIELKTITNAELQENYPEVHHYLNYFYPIDKDQEYEDCSTFPGLIELRNKINNSIVHSNNYQTNWENGFIKSLKNKLGITNILSSTAGLVPNLSGLIKLREESTKKIELHFYKSLINDFFTIEILEISSLKEIVHPVLGKKKTIGINSITTSPTGTFKNLFLDVYQSIVKSYPNAKFVPYIFDLIKIEQLYVPHKNVLNATVSDALFQKYSSYNNSIKIIGDIEYQINKLH